MNIKWALNSATIMNSRWDEELLLWEKYGWKAAEIWYSKMQPRLSEGATLESLARQMSDAGVTPVGMCAAGVSVGVEDRTGELANIVKLLDACAAMKVPALTIIIGGKTSDDLAADYDSLIDPLHKTAEFAAERGVKINLEFLGGEPINGTLGSGIELVNRVNHPAFGLLFDLCHYYVSASHLEELQLLDKGKLFQVHVDDSPRLPMEKQRSDKRCFPGEGRIDVVGMLRHLRSNAGYSGYYTVELYDPEIWTLPADETMTKLATSLRRIELELDTLN